MAPRRWSEPQIDSSELFFFFVVTLTEVEKPLSVLSSAPPLNEERGVRESGDTMMSGPQRCVR